MYTLDQVTIFGVPKANRAQNTPHPLLTPGPPKLTAKSYNIPTKVTFCRKLLSIKSFIRCNY